MIAEMECLPCLVRQAREAACMSTGNPDLRLRIIRRCLAWMAEADLDVSPPEIAAGIGRVVMELSGRDDPYREVKSLHTDMALKLLPRMDRMLAESDDPFLTGLRLAIAGNIIDLGARSQVEDADIGDTLREAMELPILGEDPGALRAEIMRAGSVLYLADNAGETVFDRKFIEQMPSGRVTVAVRGGPAINDATLADARAAGLHRVARLIDNGHAAPATVLSECSPEFRRTFDEADVVISKGQGNYESLSAAKRDVHFLFRVKCPLVAGHTGHPEGSLLLLRSVPGRS